MLDGGGRAIVRGIIRERIEKLQLELKRAPASVHEAIRAEIDDLQHEAMQLERTAPTRALIQPKQARDIQVHDTGQIDSAKN